MKKKIIKIGLVCTQGGHFEQMTNLAEFYRQFDHFWITNKGKQAEAELKTEIKYFIKAGHYTKPWTYLYQVPIALKAFYLEKPTHIISTGSGMTAFVPFLISKLLKVKFIHIDTFSRVYGYSKFGAFLLMIRQRILSQWDDPLNSRVTYIGPIFKREDHVVKNTDAGHIFVTLGTRNDPFPRLVKSVEDLVKKGVIKENVIVQAGNTIYNSKLLEIFDFCLPEVIDGLIKNAKFVITQESAGIGTKCLKYNTKFIVMPRDYQCGELPVKSDMNEDLHCKLEEIGYTRVVNNTSELKSAIKEINKLKTGFEFDNKLAIETLTKLITLS